MHGIGWRHDASAAAPTPASKPQDVPPAPVMGSGTSRRLPAPAAWGLLRMLCMSEAAAEHDLGMIPTPWPLVALAHALPEDAAAEARRALVRRYIGAVSRFLIAVSGDRDAADDLSQEFALRVLRGDLRNADPRRGRFRDYLRAMLRRLAIDYRRGRVGRYRPLTADFPGSDSGTEDLDRCFLENWRRELLDRAWESLELLQRETGRPYHAALRLKAARPGLRSPRLAGELGAELGRAVTAGGYRQTLHLARREFARLLLAEVRESLGYPPADQVEQELIDLGLIAYCRPELGPAAE